MRFFFSFFFSSPDKAIVKRLTLNDISESLTVAAEDHVTVLLVCQTFGRPRPWSDEREQQLCRCSQGSGQQHGEVEE